MSDLITELDSLLAGVSDRDPGWRECLVAASLREMPGETRAKVEDILDNHPAVKSTELRKKLAKWGYEIPYNSLIRHRRRHDRGAGCACP